MPAPHRKLILGIDEAGYGPNIGPLVIACSAWIVDNVSSPSVDVKPAAETMLQRLAPAFLSKPIKSSIRHIPLGDSKAIYVSGGSIEGLSLGVRFWLNQIEIDASNFQGFLDAIVPAFASSSADLPWYQQLKGKASRTEQFRSFDESMPLSLHESASDACQFAGLQFLGLSASAIDERRFNRDVERLGNKASLLSQASLRLAVDCLAHYVAQYTQSIDSIHIYCDKHGGRNRYQALLMDAMPEVWFAVVSESPTRSDYRTRWQNHDMHWSFLAKGDRLFASALASMTAKWIREGLMARLNCFWKMHLPDLKSTAGYPVDAKRFRAEIEGFANQRKYPLADWWRFR